MSESVVRKLLQYFESRLDLDHIRTVADRHRRALCYEPVDRLPLVLYVPYEGRDYPLYPIAETLHDPSKMMVNQLLQGFTSLYHLVDLRTDTPFCLRANMGVTLIASMFGAQIELRGNEQPWVRPLDGIDAIRALVDAPVPDLDRGLLPRALEHYAYFRHLLAGYPKCEQAFQLTLPDLQGPFDIAELLWGSDIFLALYDAPELVDALLRKITDTLLAVYGCVQTYVREDIRPDGQYQHATGVKGKLLIRSDTSVIMVAPPMYADMILPHDARLAQALGGAGIHFCGDGSRQIDTLLTMPGLQSLDFGQSFMMDMDAIYAKAREQQIALARVQLRDDRQTAGALLKRFPTGVNLMREVSSVAQAQRAWAQYVKASE